MTNVICYLIDTTYSILFINILYYKNKLYINKLIYIYTSGFTSFNRVEPSLHRLIIEFNFVFTSSSFNNRFEHESSLYEPISSKLTSSSTRLHYTPILIYNLIKD
jgi:hypothetical protein